MSDKIREKAKSAVAILATKVKDKVSFIISITDDLVKRGLSAGDLAKEMAKSVDGSGGGKPAFAQGGGRSVEKLEEAFGKIEAILKEKLYPAR